MLIKLTPAQTSALECAGLDLENEGEAVIAAAWDRGHGALEVIDATRDLLADALTELANSEDAIAEDANRDGAERRFARNACRALTNLSRKIDAQ